MANTINTVTYSGLDFDTHFDDLLARTQSRFSTNFNDFALSSLGMMLLDLEAHGLEQLSFYLDRRATDTYMATARSRTSVSKLARQLGYKMRSAVSSSVDLAVAITAPVAFPVPIPQGFQFSGPNDLIFEAAKVVTFAPGDGPTVIRLVPCFEGQTFSETFVSAGTPNQVFELRKVPANTFVVSGSVQVLVDGVSYIESEFLQFETSNQFEIGYNNDPPFLMFGDGTTGTIPVSGASITITYVAARGKTGQVAAGTIVKEVTPLVVNFTTISLQINNPSASVGGDDPESLDHAKAFAGKVFKSRQVAITRGDYESLAGSFADSLFGRVAVAQALSSRSAANDLFLKTQLSVITTAVAVPLPTVTASVTEGLAHIATCQALEADIQTDVQDIATLTTAIDAKASAAITSARNLKNNSIEVFAGSTNIQNTVVDTKGAINAIAVGLTDTLTLTKQTALLALLDKINGQASSISTASLTIQSAADSDISSMGMIRNQAADIGLDPLIAPNKLNAISQTALAISTHLVPTLDSGGKVLPSITKNLTDISSVIVDENFTVGQAIQAVMDHVDSVLAADCKSNLVTVPILARDAAGFYAPPSTGLTQALQTFLEARKEVTQTVRVTSGADFLIQAVLLIRVGVRPGFAESATKAAVEAVVDGVLRDRSFGESLFISDVDYPIKLLAAVDFVNVHIQGFLNKGKVDPSKLDADGNLIISLSEIISKGTVTVTIELAPL